MKPDRNFKLKSLYKRWLALEIDPHKRGQLKRALIQAQLAEQSANARRSKDDSGE